MIITLSEAKEMLQISHSNQDAIVTAMIKSSQEFVSQYCRVYFNESDATLTENLDGGNESLWATKLPIESVTSIVDTESDDEEVSDENYEVKSTHINTIRDGAKG